MIFNDSKYNHNWEIKPLDKLGEFKRGNSKHRPRNDPKLFTNGKYPLIQTGDIKAANLYIRNHSEAYNEFGLKQSKLWKENTLCITIAANIAETALLGYPMCFPDSVVGFTAFPNESSEIFMHYVFEYIKEKIQSTVGGSIQDNINIEYLTALNFRVPDKNYQDKIAAILSALDAKIELNRRINAELESMAKTLYDYWFVQFEFPAHDPHRPYRGTSPKSDRKTLDNNLNHTVGFGGGGRGYKSAGGKMIWNEELKREIPLGWEVAELSDIANITMGQSPPGESYNENGEGTVFFQGCTDFGNRFPSVRQFTAQPTRFAKTGDILLSVRAPVGTINIAKEDCCIGRGLAALNSKDDTITYLFEVMRNFKQVFERRNVNGTTFGSITKDDLFSLKVLKPEKKVLDEYQKIIYPTFEQQNKLELESQTLMELRDWLLPMLMNGQVTPTLPPPNGT